MIRFSDKAGSSGWLLTGLHMEIRFSAQREALGSVLFFESQDDRREMMLYQRPIYLSETSTNPTEVQDSVGCQLS